MLYKIINIKDLLPQNRPLPEFYLHLLKVESEFNQTPFTFENYQTASVSLELAQKMLDEVLEEKDKSYYYLLQGIADGLNSWINDDPSLDLSCDQHFKIAEKINPNLKKNIELLLNFFQVLEHIIKDKEIDSEEESYAEDFEDIFPDCIQRSVLTQQAVMNLLNHEYDLPILELLLAANYYENLKQDNTFISLTDAKIQLSKINNLINEKDVVERAILRDQQKNGEANIALYNLIKSGREKIEAGHFLQAEEIYKSCSQCLDSTTIDNFLKIHILASRGYIHGLFSILTPMTYDKSQLYSTYFFNAASKISHSPQSSHYINDKKLVIGFILTASNELQENDDIESYIKEMVKLGHTLYEGRKLYDDENVDLLNQYNLAFLSKCEEFYNNAAHQKESSFLNYFHLASICRILKDEELFIGYFIKFIFHGNFNNKFSERFANFEIISKAIDLNIKYFLCLHCDVDLFGNHLDDKIGNIINLNKTIGQDEISHLAEEFSSKGLIVAATLFMNISLLLEHTQKEMISSSEDDITKKQTQFLQNALWDDTIYSRLYLAIIYLDLIAYSAIHTNKKTIDLNKEFKKVAPNITFNNDKFLSEIKIKQCEEVLKSIFKTMLSTENYNDFRKILELLFVSKLAHYCASLINRNDPHASVIQEELYTIFPKWSVSFKAFFQALNPKIPSSNLSSLACTMNMLKDDNKKPKKAKGKDIKKSKLPTGFSERKRSAPPISIAKDVVAKVPDHIASLLEASMSIEESKESFLPENNVKAKDKKKNKQSRRKAFQQAYSDESPEPIADSLSHKITEMTHLELNIINNATSSPLQSESLTPVIIHAIIVPDQIKNFINLLKKSGSKRVSLVGGYVRDQLLQRNSGEPIDINNQDYDIVTDLPIKFIKDKFPELFKTDILNDEYATLEFGGLKIDLKFSSQLANNNLSELEAYRQDARTRDFTCNLLYANENGTVFDPLNIGIEGLKDVCLIAIPKANVSDINHHSNTTEDIRQSFSEDPIRMFRAIHATSMRELQFSDEMNVVLPESLIAMKAYFSEENNLGKINSLMHKLLCRGRADENFAALMNFGFLKLLFPALDELITVNKKFESWLIHELKNPPSKPSLNYIYAMFIVGMNLVNSSHNIPFSNSEMDQIENNIISATPLLTKNFEKWPFKSLIQLAKMSWLKHAGLDVLNSNKLHRSLSTSSIFHIDNSSSASEHISVSAPPVNQVSSASSIHDYYRHSASGIFKSPAQNAASSQPQDKLTLAHR